MISEEQEQFALAMAAARKARGWSLQGLANRINVRSEGTVRRWEYGETWPQAANLRAWANALDSEVPSNLVGPWEETGGLSPCPSPGAFQRHRKRNEDPHPCGCAKAWSNYITTYQASRKAAARTRQAPLPAAFTDGNRDFIYTLTAARLDQGLSRTAVDQAARFPYRTIRRYEQRYCYPVDQYLTRWAAVLGVPVPDTALRGRVWPRPNIGCPSSAAYRRHIADGTDPGPCGCRTAHSAYINEWRSRRRRHAPTRKVMDDTPAGTRQRPNVVERPFERVHRTFG